MNLIPRQSGTAFALNKGEVLRVLTPKDQQVSDLFCFNARDKSEVLSAGRSIDYNDTIYLSKGHRLYSQRSNVMLTILEDSCGVHDFLMTPCSLKMFQIVGDNDDYHRSCHENLWNHFAPFGLYADQIGTTFNIFMNVKVDTTGRLSIHPPVAKAGDFILLRAEMDLIVGLTACSHEETNNHECKPICYGIENPLVF
jgi:uncharacterized protein YcgI (DUF1989 family)